MEILVKIEPVLCQGNICDKTYYGFRIVGLQGKITGPSSPVFTCACAAYPGNDAMREFFNSAVNKQVC